MGEGEINSKDVMVIVGIMVICGTGGASTPPTPTPPAPPTPGCSGIVDEDEIIVEVGLTMVGLMTPPPTAVV